MENSQDPITELFKKYFFMIESIAQSTGCSRKFLFELVSQEFLKVGEVEKEKILTLAKQAKEDKEKPDISNKNCWLIIGETGMGKSALVNQIMKKEVAPENSSTDSETMSVEVYTSDEFVLIDTPGLFDTRLEIQNKKIMEEISQKVQDIQDMDSSIDCIFLMWNPTAIRKFRYEKIMEELIKAFGNDVLYSLVLFINKETDSWTQTHRDVAVNFLEVTKPPMPFIVQDVKKLDISRLIEKQNEANPFDEVTFLRCRYRQFVELFFPILGERIKIEEEIEAKMREKKLENEEKILETKIKSQKETLKSLKLEERQIISNLEQAKRKLIQDIESKESQAAKDIGKMIADIENNYNERMKAMKDHAIKTLESLKIS